MSAGFSQQQIALVLLAALFVVIGVGVGLEARLRPGRARLRLAGVGPLSQITHVVIALACLGVAYHIAAYALHWPLHAPMWIAIAFAVAASLGSIGIDALEHRADARDGPGDGSSGEPPEDGP